MYPPIRCPQARRSRTPNVSPARTLLPRGAGWRIALLAVFRKENRTRDPLQRSQGGKQGAGLGDRFTTSRSARGAALDSSQHVFGVVGYASLFQECQELLLECYLLVVLALIADVGGYLIELRRTHAEGPISVLPLKCEATLVHESRGVCLERVDRGCQRYCCRQQKEEMAVVRHSSCS